MRAEEARALMPTVESKAHRRLEGILEEIKHAAPNGQCALSVRKGNTGVDDLLKEKLYSLGYRVEEYEKHFNVLW